MVLRQHVLSIESLEVEVKVHVQWFINIPVQTQYNGTFSVVPLIRNISEHFKIAANVKGQSMYFHSICIYISDTMPKAFISNFQ